MSGLNLYAYAHNDPINLSDPSGLDPCPKGQKKKGCSGLPDIEVFAPPMLPIPRLPMAPHLPRSPGTGGGSPGGGFGGGGGTGGGNNPQTPSPQCFAAIGDFVTNLALDGASAYLIVTGTGLVYVGGRAIVRGVLAEGASVFYNGGLVGLKAGAVVATRKVGRDLARAGSGQLLNGVTTVGTGMGHIATGVAADAAQGQVPQSPWGIVPGVGTWNAAKAVDAEC